MSQKPPTVRHCYKALVSKHEEANEIANCWNQFKKQSHKRIEYIEQDVRCISDKYSHELDRSKNDFERYIKLMQENNAILKKTNENIATSMKTVAAAAAMAERDEIINEVNKTNMEVANLATNLDETVSVVDFNSKILQERISSMEKWMTTVDHKNGNYSKFIPVERNIKTMISTHNNKTNTNSLSQTLR